MSLWRQVTHGLRVLLHRDAADRDVADEVEHYLEQATAEQIARGVPPNEARRAARLELGNVTLAREQVRNYGWENILGSTAADLRYAARRLAQHPGFTGLTGLTLALGIGATTAIFSAVNPILFRSLPYPHAGHIAMIWDTGPERARSGVTFGTYRELAERSHAFEAMAALKPWQPTMTSAAEPERLDGQRVSASYFHVLGVPPVLGRDFDASEDRRNGPNVVIVSDRLWRRRFGADPGIIGRRITLDDSPFDVIGVMPPGFENVLATSAEVWAPLQYDISEGQAWGHHLRLVGRVRPEMATDQAARELDRIAHNPVAEFPRVPWASLEQGLLVSSLQEDITRGVRPALLAVLGAVLVVLLIACVNVTNLLLAHGVQRGGEFAMRAALGADQRRVIRQLVTESLLLSLIGGAGGLGVAVLGVRALAALAPPGLPRVNAIALDAPVFAFALGVSALVGVAVGLVPALYAARGDLLSGLQQGSRRTAGGHHGTRRALVVAEVALALMLLVGAGLLLRSLRRLFAVEPGFEASGLVTMQVQVVGQRFAADSTTFRFFTQALDAVRQVPGVMTAALTSQLPLSGDFDVYGVRFDPSPADDPGEVSGGTFRYAVSSGYIEAMRIPLRHGRTLDERDRTGAPLVALISESVAKRRLPGLDPIGQHLRVGDTGPYTVVGVVGDVKQMSLALSQPDAVYVPATQWRFADPAMSLVVRAKGGVDAAALATSVRKAVWSVDKDQPVVRVATMTALLAASAGERGFVLILFEAFALVALALAAAGIYGVLSGSVKERSREIGVRSALGASRASILAMVMRQGLVLTVVGATIGLAGAVAASRAVTALLYGVSRLDPVTYLVVIALLAGVSAVACWLPAWRAARVDPVIALRAE